MGNISQRGVSLACTQPFFFHPPCLRSERKARKATHDTHRDTNPTRTRQNVLLLKRAGTLLPIPDVHCGAVRLWPLRPAPAGHPRGVRRPRLADVRPPVSVITIIALARTRRTEGNDVERYRRQQFAVPRPDIETLFPQPIINNVESLGMHANVSITHLSSSSPHHHHPSHLSITRRCRRCHHHHLSTFKVTQRAPSFTLIFSAP